MEVSTSSQGRSTTAEIGIQCNIIPGEAVSIESVVNEESAQEYIKHHCSVLVSAFIEEATLTQPERRDLEYFYRDVCLSLEVFRVSTENLHQLTQEPSHAENQFQIDETVESRIDSTRRIFKALAQLRTVEDWRAARTTLNLLWNASPSPSYDRVFELRYIPTDDANPGGSNAQFVAFTVEEAWKVCESDVKKWISNRFRENPSQFLKNDTGLLVVEVLQSLL